MHTTIVPDGSWTTLAIANALPPPPDGSTATTMYFVLNQLGSGVSVYEGGSGRHLGVN